MTADLEAGAPPCSPESQKLELVFAVVAYMAASAGMMVINKLVLRGCSLPIAICTIQMSFTVLVLLSVPSMRSAIHFGSWNDALRWGRTVPMLFAVMLVSSMIALDHASMGALVVMRNLAPVPAIMAEKFIDKQMKVDAQTGLALLFAFSGVALYARNDLHSSWIGILFMCTNLFAAVLERLVQRKLIALEPIDVSKQGMMLLNNGVGAILLLPIMAAFGEIGKLGQLGGFSSWQWTLLLLSCVNGVAISYAGIYVQKFVTASTFLVLTNTNKFGVIAFGIFVLGEARAWQAVLGSVIALAGGAWYGKARSDMDQSSKTSVADDGKDHNGDETASACACEPHSIRYWQAAVVFSVLLFSTSSFAASRRVDTRHVPPPPPLLVNAVTQRANTTETKEHRPHAHMDGAFIRVVQGVSHHADASRPPRPHSAASVASAAPSENTTAKEFNRPRRRQRRRHTQLQRLQLQQLQLDRRPVAKKEAAKKEAKAGELAQDRV
uniref:Sugar phosphate transporter domain-containing protein n=1 Tax=Haptolina ericina TaxID=156174 RepID=A0A7S3AC99_9EUKA|mmetsp:Transcript_1154/g.2467  ORF Transcript_1154/g.2467 Transcript_1154/m.2467 type:complete len:495 (+) Transcript_1154:95-1579(+)